MKMYCSQCGTATQHGGKQPNFCHSCGHAFLDASVAEVHPLEDKETTKSTWALDMAKLDVNIETDDTKSYKLGEVVGTLDPDVETSDDFIPAETPTKEETLDSIKQESKTLREKK